jgi:hypothetical protein
MKKYNSNDLLGIYKLIEFSYRKANDYYWKVECQKCHQNQILKLNKSGMISTKFCSKCLKNKYVKYQTPEEYIRAKITVNKDGCWLWNGHISKKTGYCISKYRSIQKKAHAFSYETFKGNISEGLCICHKCDVRHCVNPDHLWTGTHSDNIQDCIIKHRNNPPKGQRSGSAKLKIEDIIEIRKLYESGILQKDLAKKFKVSRATICCICKNKTWKI